MAVLAYIAHRTHPLLLGGETTLYADVARRILAGELPYRDFDLAYPPLSLLPFTAPHWLVLGSPLSDRAYRMLYVLSALGATVALGFLVLRTARRQSRIAERHAAFVFAAGALLLAPLLLWRFDFFPALWTGLGLLALTRGRPGWSGVALGLGVATKLYPAVLGPVFLAERLARGRGPDAARLVAGTILALAVTTLPFAAAAPSGLARGIGYHVDRGVQVESILGGAILLAARAGWTDAEVERTPGADEVVSSWAAIAPVLPAVTVAGILLTALLAFVRVRGAEARGRETWPVLIAHATLALLVFVLTSKVLSPQFLVWLLPLVPLLPRPDAVRLLGAFALTAALFPWQYWDLVRGEWSALLLLNARNALLVVAAVSLCRPGRGPAVPPSERPG